MFVPIPSHASGEPSHAVAFAFSGTLLVAVSVCGIVSKWAIALAEKTSPPTAVLAGSVDLGPGFRDLDAHARNIVHVEWFGGGCVGISVPGHGLWIVSPQNTISSVSPMLPASLPSASGSVWWSPDSTACAAGKAPLSLYLSESGHVCIGPYPSPTLRVENPTLDSLPVPPGSPCLASQVSSDGMTITLVLGSAPRAPEHAIINRYSRVSGKVRVICHSKRGAYAQRSGFHDPPLPIRKSRRKRKFPPSSTVNVIRDDSDSTSSFSMSPVDPEDSEDKGAGVYSPDTPGRSSGAGPGSSEAGPPPGESTLFALTSSVVYPMSKPVAAVLSCSAETAVIISSSSKLFIVNLVQPGRGDDGHDH